MAGSFALALSAWAKQGACQGGWKQSLDAQGWPRRRLMRNIRISAGAGGAGAHNYRAPGTGRGGLAGSELN